MSARLYALGYAAFRARVRVLLAWVGVLVVVLGAAMTLGVGTNNTYSFPGTESQDALDALGRTFQFSGTSAQLVAVAPSAGDVTDAPFRTAVEDAVTALEKVLQVASVTSPYDSTSAGDIAPDRSAVLVPVQMTVGTVEVLPPTSDALQAEGRKLRAALPTGSEVSVGGQLFVYRWTAPHAWGPWTATKELKAPGGFDTGKLEYAPAGPPGDRADLGRPARVHLAQHHRPATADERPAGRSPGVRRAATMSDLPVVVVVVVQVRRTGVAPRR